MMENVDGTEIMREIKLGDFKKARISKARKLLKSFKLKNRAFVFPYIPGYNKDLNPYVVESDGDGGWVHLPMTKPCTGFIRTRDVSVKGVGTCIHTDLAVMIRDSIRAIRRKGEKVNREAIIEDIEEYNVLHPPTDDD